MIYRRVDVVDPNGVDAKSLHERGIAQTKCPITQWVRPRIKTSRAARLISKPRLVQHRIVKEAQDSYATPMIWNRALVTELTKLAPWTLMGCTADTTAAQSATAREIQLQDWVQANSVSGPLHNRSHWQHELTESMVPLRD